MTSVPAGTWVEIEQIVLTADERAPGLPEDTRAVPLVLRVCGFLVDDVPVDAAEPGGRARIRSVIGREHEGRLVTVNPGYTHSFGETVPELLTIGTRVQR